MMIFFKKIERIMLNIIYTTLNNPETAEKIAADAVREKLAACVNIISKVSSFYIWENNLEKSVECILLFKTNLDNKNKLMAWLEKNHPYQTPSIFALNADSSENFFRFIEENTQ